MRKFFIPFTIHFSITRFQKHNLRMCKVIQREMSFIGHIARARGLKAPLFHYGQFERWAKKE